MGLLQEANKGFLTETLLCIRVNVHKDILQGGVLLDGTGIRINIPNAEVGAFHTVRLIKVLNKDGGSGLHMTIFINKGDNEILTRNVRKEGGTGMEVVIRESLY